MCSIKTMSKMVCGVLAGAIIGAVTGALSSWVDKGKIDWLKVIGGGLAGAVLGTGLPEAQKAKLTAAGQKVLNTIVSWISKAVG